MDKAAEKSNSSEEKLKAYLRKTPSILIALVSAVVTIVSVMIGYAGRLSNIAFLKYWNIDEIYATIETKNVAYLVINSIIWTIAVLISSAIIESSFVNHYHYSTFARYAKKQIKAFSKAYNERKNQLTSVEKMFWNHKKATSEDFEIWKGIESVQNELIEQEQLLKSLRKGNRRELWTWRKILLAHYALAEIILFFALWLSTTAITASENFTVLLSSLFSLLFSTFWAYCTTKNQRSSIKSSITQIISGKDETDFFKQLEKMNELENKQYEKNRSFFDFDFKLAIVLIIALLMMVLTLRPLFSYMSAASQKEFEVLIAGDSSEAVIFHSEDTYILEKAEINENIITIDTAKQRILKTNDIAFEKMTFDTVVKK